MLIGQAIGVILPDLLILGVMCANILRVGYIAYSWYLNMAQKN